MDKFLIKLLTQRPTSLIHVFGSTTRQFMAEKIAVSRNRKGPTDQNPHGPSEKRHKSQDSSTEFSIKDVKGDLFTCPPSMSLVHCISADAKMGKGIAVQFKKRFGGVDDIKRQGQKPGGVAVLKHEQRYIYNMVTKERYFHKPTYNSLTSSLQTTKEHCLAHGVTELAMPTIGCGLDGLNWRKVSGIIYDVFKDSLINISVYSL